MNESRAALRYAKAVLDLALDEKMSSEVEKDMRTIASFISGSPELKEMLVNPVIPGNTKKAVLTELFRGTHHITIGLLSLLVDNKRIAMLNEVALKYIILNEQRKGQDVAFLTTTVPLTADLEKKALAQISKITDKKVSITNKIDEGILGGFILRVGDVQYDASIATKLNNLKREFKSSV